MGGPVRTVLPVIIRVAADADHAACGTGRVTDDDRLLLLRPPISPSVSLLLLLLLLMATMLLLLLLAMMMMAPLALVRDPFYSTAAELWPVFPLWRCPGTHHHGRQAFRWLQDVLSPSATGPVHHLWREATCGGQGICAMGDVDTPERPENSITNKFIFAIECHLTLKYSMMECTVKFTPSTKEKLTS